MTPPTPLLTNDVSRPSRENLSNEIGKKEVYSLAFANNALHVSFGL